MSSGCAPNASNAGRLRGDFGPGFIGSVNGIAVDISDFGRIFAAKIRLLSGSGNVMRAMDDGLHPAQPTVTRRADLFAGEIRDGKRLVNIAALEKLNKSIHPARAHCFAR